jgi:hypothetical protein
LYREHFHDIIDIIIPDAAEGFQQQSQIKLGYKGKKMNKPSLRKTSAFSLVEIIVALFLLSLAIIPIFGIIPTACMSIKKGEDYAAASLYAQQIEEVYRFSEPCLYPAYFHNEWDMNLNSTDFQVKLDIYGVDAASPHKVMDVISTIYWKKNPALMHVFSTVYYNKL